MIIHCRIKSSFWSGKVLYFSPVLLHVISIIFFITINLIMKKPLSMIGKSSLYDELVITVIILFLSLAHWQLYMLLKLYLASPFLFPPSLSLHLLYPFLLLSLTFFLFLYPSPSLPPSLPSSLSLSLSLALSLPSLNAVVMLVVLIKWCATRLIHLAISWSFMWVTIYTELEY